MGRIGTVLNHTIDKLIEIIVETRAGYNQKAFLYNSSGEDSPPVKQDKILLVKVDGTGRNILLGVLTESQGAKPGEKIFFGRDEKGAIKSKLSFLGDGDVILENDKDTITKSKGDKKETIKGKFYFGNDSQNAAKLLIGLIDEIIAIETFGSPPKHKIMPTTVTKLEAYKNQVKALYLEGA